MSDAAPKPPFSTRVRQKLGEMALEGVVAWLLTFLLPLVAIGALVGAVAGGVAGERAAQRSAPAAAQDSDSKIPGLGGRGKLEVTSVPPGGTVRLDGRLVGKTPIDRLDVDAGRRAVVIELDGYAPYVGTVTVGDGKDVSVEAVLTPAILVAAASGAGSGTGTGTGSGSAPAATPPRARKAYVPPKRDCDHERSICKEHCDDANWRCTSSCQYCGSCNTSMTWDQCNNICNTCKQGCEQNEKFCESSCDGQYDVCNQ